VIQESLTNCTKHARGSHVDVRLEHEASHLVIEVRDRGPGAPAGVRRGQGLTGMAERVALYDGTLTLDGSADGFVVRARFPVDPEGSGEAA
jgi:signal transduction histidine kinase